MVLLALHLLRVAASFLATTSTTMCLLSLHPLRVAAEQYAQQQRPLSLLHLPRPPPASAPRRMGGCADVGCHGYSADGVSWTLSATPAYGYGVELDDGSSMTLKRRERPQLVFDPASGRPTHLINGAEPPQKRGGQEDFTYSIIVPLPYAA